MTPFMVRVRESLEGGTTPPPRLVPSVSRSRSIGVHQQVTTRALAEQLISEANAVLVQAAGDRRLLLVDEMAPDRLAFTIACGPRWVRVETAFESRSAVARVKTRGRQGPAQELAEEAEMAGLVLDLLRGSD